MIVRRKFGEPHDFLCQQCLTDRDRLVDGQPSQSLPAFLLRLSLVVLRVANHDCILLEAAEKFPREKDGCHFLSPKAHAHPHRNRR